MIKLLCSQVSLPGKSYRERKSDFERSIKLTVGAYGSPSIGLLPWTAATCRRFFASRLVGDSAEFCNGGRSDKSLRRRRSLRDVRRAWIRGRTNCYFSNETVHDAGNL